MNCIDYNLILKMMCVCVCVCVHTAQTGEKEQWVCYIREKLLSLVAIHWIAIHWKS